MINIKNILEEMECEAEDYKILKQKTEKVILEVRYRGAISILRVYVDERAKKIENLYTRINGASAVLPTVYSSKWCQGKYYALIEEKISGQSFRDYILESVEQEKYDDVKYYGKINEVFELLKGLCEATGGLHQLNPPVIHCDLKPEHIFIEDREHIRIIDLDIAITEGESKKQVEGTRGYISPEATSKTGMLTVASDIYALGEIVVDLCEPFKEDIRFDCIRNQIDALVYNCQRNDSSRINNDTMLRKELIKIQYLVMIYRKEAEIKEKKNEVTVIDKNSIRKQEDNSAEVTIKWPNGKGKVVLYNNKLVIVNYGVLPSVNTYKKYYFDKIKAALYQEKYNKKIIRLIYGDNEKDVVYIDDIGDSEITKQIGELLSNIVVAREKGIVKYYTDLFYSQDVRGNIKNKECNYEKRIIIGELLRQQKSCQCNKDLEIAYENMVKGAKDIKNPYIKDASKYYAINLDELRQECNEEADFTDDDSSSNGDDFNKKENGTIKGVGKVISRITKRVT